MTAATVVAVVLLVVMGGVIGFTVGRDRRIPTVQPVPEPEAPSAGFGALTGAVDRMDLGIVVADHEGVITYRNRMAQQLSTARHSRSLVEDCVQRLLAMARSDGSASEAVDLFGPPAELFVVSAHPYADGSGSGAMAIIEDRSELRRTETVRRDFVANISHELRTPIAALGLLAETIVGEDDPEVTNRLATRMVSESDRAAHTVDDLLELASIEFADDAAHSEVSLTAVVKEACSRISNAAEQAGVMVAVDVDEPVVVMGDDRQLVSAVFNLLDNAVKYSPGGGEVQVRCRADDAGGGVELSVTDHGIGIPRSSTDRVFERFYRVDRARSRNTGGTGLGLAIVRHVVHNHGGEVAVDSGEGRGSTFTIRLPGRPGAHGDSAPENSAPDDSAPENSTPDDSTPDDSTPEDSTPEDSTPDDRRRI